MPTTIVDVSEVPDWREGVGEHSLGHVYIDPNAPGVFVVYQRLIQIFGEPSRYEYEIEDLTSTSAERCVNGRTNCRYGTDHDC